MFSFFNKPGDQRVKNAVIKFLDAQLFLYGKDIKNLPLKALDEYSLGYIAGVIDAYFENISKGSDSKLKLETLLITFVALFGKNKALEAIYKIETCANNDSKKYYEAMGDGGTEFNHFIIRKVPIPSIWATYIYDIDTDSVLGK